MLGTFEFAVIREDYDDRPHLFERFGAKLLSFKLSDNYNNSGLAYDLSKEFWQAAPSFLSSKAALEVRREIVEEKHLLFDTTYLEERAWLYVKLNKRIYRVTLKCSKDDDDAAALAALLAADSRLVVTPQSLGVSLPEADKGHSGLSNNYVEVVESPLLKRIRARKGRRR